MRAELLLPPCHHTRSEPSVRAVPNVSSCNNRKKLQKWSINGDLLAYAHEEGFFSFPLLNHNGLLLILSATLQLKEVIAFVHCLQTRVTQLEHIVVSTCYWV